MWGSKFPQYFGNGTDTHIPQNVFFVFLMQFDLWRVAAFVSSAIHLFIDGNKLVKSSGGSLNMTLGNKDLRSLCLSKEITAFRNKYIGDDTKAATRQSPNGIKKPKKCCKK